MSARSRLTQKSSPVSEFEPETADRLMVKWLCKEKLPFSLVECSEFREFIAHLNKDYQIPSRARLVMIARSLGLQMVDDSDCGSD